jgi:hypothetical protein
MTTRHTKWFLFVLFRTEMLWVAAAVRMSTVSDSRLHFQTVAHPVHRNKFIVVNYVQCLHAVNFIFTQVSVDWICRFCEICSNQELLISVLNRTSPSITSMLVRVQTTVGFQPKWSQWTALSTWLCPIPLQCLEYMSLRALYVCSIQRSLSGLDRYAYQHPWPYFLFLVTTFRYCPCFFITTFRE